ncbi:glyoxalase/bleomycin resistance protein/dioxygenase [Corallococcus coralloides]|uniref:Glyoxalase/bleomycin resistance protein/dioxygenase n=1 Tax=Corallococcus coralloides TaxID=184914 RepID=A0A410RPA7_CORCK|nr:VOC family protein [Corallococcus coralloides]QAT83779.1 glyoxalase/bleomycin resistance protein/dioxygenase [Corallococcus coralloides]
MSDENPSILSHVSIGTNDFARAVAFYDAVLTPLGCRRVLDFPNAVAYGRQFPEFWVQTPIDGKPATVGNGTHFCFIATSKQAVDAFHQAALKAGATDDGAPGPRPLYGPPYYGCFVRDPDGHKVEAHFWDTSLGGHEGT